MRKRMGRAGSFLFLIAIASGCASSQPVKTQAYANLTNHRVFEYDFPVVWKGIEETFRKFKVTDRNPSDVDEIEMKKLTHRNLETDWIYSQSRDKYVEYPVNGVPRKQYLQARVKYEVLAKSVMGGTEVTVKSTEEVQDLKRDGTPGGYERMSEPDPSRSSEILDKIKQAILAAAP